MTNMAFQKDVGAYLTVAAGLSPNALTTASGAQTGTGIDRTAYYAPPASCKVIVNGRATVAATKQVTFNLALQHGDTTTAYTEIADKDGNTSTGSSHKLTVGTTSSTATQTNVSGVRTFDYTLTNAKKYIRVVLTPAWTGLSTAVTEAAAASVSIVFGGNYILPPA